VIVARRKSWHSAHHEAEWRRAIFKYCTPILDMHTKDIGQADVMAILKPLWETTQVTANSLRYRIEKVLDYAKFHGLREGDNPAKWKGHLDAAGLPKRPKVEPFKAVPYKEVPALVQILHEVAPAKLVAMAIIFMILTARSAEVRGATWDEFDFKMNIWTVPTTRMRKGREHRVPLSRAALAVLAKMETRRCNDFVFPGKHKGKTGNQISHGAPTVLMHELGRPESVHGFRSSFRDWVGDETSFSKELTEAALSHVEGDVTEQAYRRSDALEKRRALMEAWGDCCTNARPAGANVIPMIA
jgi:integrase